MEVPPTRPVGPCPAGEAVVGPHIHKVVRFHGCDLPGGLWEKKLSHLCTYLTGTTWQQGKRVLGMLIENTGAKCIIACHLRDLKDKPTQAKAAQEKNPGGMAAMIPLCLPPSFQGSLPSKSFSSEKWVLIGSPLHLSETSLPLPSFPTANEAILNKVIYNLMLNVYWRCECQPGPDRAFSSQARPKTSNSVALFMQHVS